MSRGGGTSRSHRRPEGLLPVSFVASFTPRNDAAGGAGACSAFASRRLERTPSSRSRAADSQHVALDDCDASGEVVDVVVIHERLHHADHGWHALVIGSHHDDPRMRAGRVGTHVAEAAIQSDQQSPFADRREQDCGGSSRPPSDSSSTVCTSWSRERRKPATAPGMFSSSLIFNDHP